MISISNYSHYINAITAGTIRTSSRAERNLHPRGEIALHYYLRDGGRERSKVIHVIYSKCSHSHNSQLKYAKQSISQERNVLATAGVGIQIAALFNRRQ